MLCAAHTAVPVGVGSEGALTLRAAEMDKLLSTGMAYTQELGLSWPEDREVTEEHVSGKCLLALVRCTTGQSGKYSSRCL